MPIPHQLHQGFETRLWDKSFSIHQDSHVRTAVLGKKNRTEVIVARYTNKPNIGVGNFRAESNILEHFELSWASRIIRVNGEPIVF